MLNLTFLTQKINGFSLTLFFDENQTLVFISARNDYLDDARKNFKNTTFQPQVKNQTTVSIFLQLEKYFQGELTIFQWDQINYKLRGTDFQLQVWKELMNLKYGEIISYSELAQKIQRPQAVRAVGSAVGMNPLPILIPCHRVNGKNNSLRGYRGGLKLKQILQNLELKIPLQGDNSRAK